MSVAISGKELFNQIAKKYFFYDQKGCDLFNAYAGLLYENACCLFEEPNSTVAEHDSPLAILELFALGIKNKVLHKDVMPSFLHSGEYLRFLTDKTVQEYIKNKQQLSEELLNKRVFLSNSLSNKMC